EPGAKRFRALMRGSVFQTAHDLGLVPGNGGGQASLAARRARILPQAACRQVFAEVRALPIRAGAPSLARRPQLVKIEGGADVAGGRIREGIAAKERMDGAIPFEQLLDEACEPERPHQQ